MVSKMMGGSYGRHSATKGYWQLRLRLFYERPLGKSNPDELPLGDPMLPSEPVLVFHDANFKDL